jgi:hypothetical protein
MAFVKQDDFLKFVSENLSIRPTFLAWQRLLS